MTRLTRIRSRARVAAALALGMVLLTGCDFDVYQLPLPGGTDTGDNPIEVTVKFEGSPETAMWMSWTSSGPGVDDGPTRSWPSCPTQTAAGPCAASSRRASSSETVNREFRLRCVFMMSLGDHAVPPGPRCPLPIATIPPCHPMSSACRARTANAARRPNRHGVGADGQRMPR